MKTPRRVTDRRESDDLAMTSMIDVVFLLLIFFVWTSSFDLPETNLPGSIAMASDPEETSAEARPDRQSSSVENKPTEIIVRIIHQSGGNSYRIGAIELADLSAVQERLTTIAGLSVSTLVIVDPDPAISVADVIDVFDLARSLRFIDVLLAVEQTPDLAR